MQHGPMNHAGHDERSPREAAPRRPDAPEGNGGKGQGLFSDLSVPQVAAGALAAVTSMLLSNQIGIAGSVIGVAVGSVVSTVASSLYKRAIARGASRIKEKIVLPGEGAEDGGGAAGTGASGTRTPGPVAGVAADAGDESGTVTSDGTRIAPEHLRERARARHDRTVQKRVTVGVLAVAVVAAIVGVWLSAGFVTLATGGQGLGEKVSIVRTSRDDAADAEKDHDTASGDKASTDGASTTGTSSSATAGGGASTDGTSGSTGSSTGTGAGSDTGTGADGAGSGSGTSAGSGTGIGTDGGTGSGSGSGTGADASGSGTGTGGTSGSTGSSTGTGTGTSGAGSGSGGGASAQSQGGASQGAAATSAP